MDDSWIAGCQRGWLKCADTGIRQATSCKEENLRAAGEGRGMTFVAKRNGHVLRSAVDISASVLSPQRMKLPTYKLKPA